MINDKPKAMQVFVPSTDKESLMREVQDSYRPEAAKAVVDDCYLGYIKLDELRALLEKLAESDTSESDGHDLSTYQKTCRTIVAECLACREPKLCSLAVEYLDVSSFSLEWPFRILKALQFRTTELNSMITHLLWVMLKGVNE